MAIRRNCVEKKKSKAVMASGYAFDQVVQISDSATNRAS
jgi:hypothetical protein